MRVGASLFVSSSEDLRNSSATASGASDVRYFGMNEDVVPVTRLPLPFMLSAAGRRGGGAAGQRGGGGAPLLSIHKPNDSVGRGRDLSAAFRRPGRGRSIQVTQNGPRYALAPRGPLSQLTCSP